MERLRISYQQWALCKSLTVQVARELADAKFKSADLKAELEAVLKAEAHSRAEFEMLMREENAKPETGPGGDGMQ